MKKTILFLLFVFLLLAIISSLIFFYQRRTFIGRARSLDIGFSIENSYVFASPLRARAGSDEKIRVTVFVLNNQGLGVQGRRVVLANQPNLAIETVQGLTDEFGKAVFDVESAKAGEYAGKIFIDSRQLPQSVRLSFY